MSNWIWENRTWVFSGVGVLILALLGKIFIHLFRSWLKPPVERAAAALSASRNSSVIGTPVENGAAVLMASTNSSVTGSPVASGSNISQSVEISFSPVPAAPAPSGFSATPTADEIVKRIESLPPYERNMAGENYKGVRVTWPTRFQYIWQEDETHTVLMTYGSGEHGAPVTTRINISDFPRLRTALPGDHLQVTATIEEVKGIGRPIIKLEDAKIDFLSFPSPEPEPKPEPLRARHKKRA